MTDLQIALVVGIGLGLSMALTLLVVVRPLLKLRRTQAASGGALERTATGGVSVPVLMAFSQRRGFLWHVRSKSLSRPELTIAPGALHYRTMAAGEFPYAEIEQVDVRRALFGGKARLLFLGDSNRRIVSVDVIDFDAARRVLKALPPYLPLSVDAATLRDGVPDAATPGLPRYRGRTA